MPLITEFDQELNLGGKIAGLVRLQAMGLMVPQFCVLNHLETLDVQAVFEQISQVLNLKHNQKVILRSSADLEDGQNNSFAGVFESSVIFWQIDNFELGLKKLNQSLKSPKLLTYLQMQKIKELPKLNIIVQKFIDFDCSGVGFSSNPQKPETGTLLNVTRGGARLVVEGRESEQISVSYFGKTASDSQILSKKQILKINAVLTKLRQVFEANVDIEFGFKNQQLWLLQCRPITTFTSPQNYLLDSSNIRENFPQQVLPLTYSILQDIYSQSYFDLIANNGHSERFLWQYKYLFDNLLANFQGQLFYNIGNWYQFSKLLPGSKSNNQALQKLITGKIEDYLPADIKLSSGFKFKYYCLFLWKYLNFGQTIRKYQSNAKTWLNSLLFVDYKNLPLAALYHLYQQLRANLDHETYTNAENDFLLMFFVHKLRNKVGEQKLNQALSWLSLQNPISSQQITKLKLIKEQILAKEELADKLNAPKKLLLQISQNPKYQHIFDSILNYLQSYCGRFPQELNLAKSDASVQTVEDVVNLALNQAIFGNQKINLAKPELSFLEDFYLQQIQIYLENRENNRLIRAQFFAVLRKLFTQTEKQLIKLGFLEESGDIHYLSAKEIWDFVNLNSYNITLKELIKLRKKEYQNTSMSKPNLWGSSNMQDFYEGKIKQSILAKTTENEELLQGLACSSGTVQGKVTILESYPENFENLEIIAIKNLDPGWVILFAHIKGILIQQGGLLSHGAIIAREMQIPAIINIDIDKLQNGQEVLLDANSGVVKMIQKS